MWNPFKKRIEKSDKEIWEFLEWLKTPEGLIKLDQAVKAKAKIEGDGKAEFFGLGTEEEYNEMVKEDKGIKGLFGIGK